MSHANAFTPPASWPRSEREFSAAVETVRGPCAADATTTEAWTVTLRDTADHRVARAGYRLSCAPTGDRREDWRLIGPDGEVAASAAVALPAAAFGDELPSGPLQTLLTDLSRGRALHPVAEMRVEETVTALRDDEGKIRCRLVLTVATGSEGTRRVEFGVRALKGYEADARRVRARIADQFGWPVQSVPAVAQVQAAMVPAAGLAGGDIRADDPAGPAMREILSALLDVLEDRLSGVLADRHPDYLHQFRVAVRRTRSALSQLSEAIALEGRAEAVDGFRWLGQVTSAARDLDVQLMDLAARRAELGAEGATLDPLERHLIAVKTAAHRDLVLELSGTRFQTLINHWRASLSPSSANWTATEALRAPFGAVVAARARRLLNKVLRDGRRIGPHSEAEMLHDLRKRMKKLRYVTEFLAEVLPRAEVKPAIKALKGLQDVLGRVQDREIQVEALRGYGRALAGRSGGSAEALMAIGAWGEELDRDRRVARAEFADAFERFAASETQAVFHGIFARHDDKAHGGKGHGRRNRPGEKR